MIVILRIHSHSLRHHNRRIRANFISAQSSCTSTESSMFRRSKSLAVVLTSFKRTDVKYGSSSVSTPGSRIANSPTMTSTPAITVTPTIGMVDDTVRIQLSGFHARENVTLVAKLLENRVQFESRCVYKTDDNGCADNFSSASSGGTFQGIKPMGLFWSLKSDPPTRLIKKDVNAPMVVNIKVFLGTHVDNILPETPATEIQVQRLFLRPGVKRIPLSGRFQGTIFIPEGKGPFPALVDLYGAFVSLIETRAALLASHGYVTLALSYMLGPNLPRNMSDMDFEYIKDACKWLSEQDYVNKNELGAIGVSYGGGICLKLASVLPQIRAVVSVSGIPFSPNTDFPGFRREPDNEWPDKNKAVDTEEGFDIINTYDCEQPLLTEAWKHGAQILIIGGLDDKQVHPKWHDYFYKESPDEYKSSIQVHCYPGAGHLIEPPYLPHVRATVVDGKRLTTIFWVPGKYHDTGIPMMIGGWTETHAFAQQDSWGKILTFFENNLKNSSPGSDALGLNSETVIPKSSKL